MDHEQSGGGSSIVSTQPSDCPRESHQELAALAPLFALLSRLVVRELDAELLAVLRQPGMLEVFEKAQPGCARYLSQAGWHADDFEQAAVEFTGLFLVPEGVRPQASAWLPGERERVGAQISGFALNVMQALQLQPDDPDLRGLPPDHLAVLLALVSAVVQAEHAEERQLGTDIFVHNLAPWLPAFGRAVHERARMPVYQALGTLFAQIAQFSAESGIVASKHNLST